MHAKDMCKAGVALLKLFGFGGVVWGSNFGRNSGVPCFHQRLVQRWRCNRKARKMATQQSQA